MDYEWVLAANNVLVTCKEGTAAHCRACLDVKAMIYLAFQIRRFLENGDGSNATAKAAELFARLAFFHGSAR